MQNSLSDIDDRVVIWLYSVSLCMPALTLNVPRGPPNGYSESVSKTSKKHEDAELK